MLIRKSSSIPLVIAQAQRRSSVKLKVHLLLFAYVLCPTCPSRGDSIRYSTATLLTTRLIKPFPPLCIFHLLPSPTCSYSLLLLSKEFAKANSASLLNMKILVLGLPNVGKSSLLNALRDAGQGVKKGSSRLGRSRSLFLPRHFSLLFL
jgi:ribosome biogenesis GTPase A